ncbi:hypothetical protein, conserved [Trypanosoma brucei gambiense DAL972]|uniref:GPI mannosyltransferase 2 n=1 Tax=Trypanosoma brucei gambiense (strain MHOM/CI/86/DAL972) TaxID=679716 RepID=C9ZZT3_TRYB9|nr:hypothetical protein, conserved [Trypanosoma brucei gambiense DAL972]CBH16491.1 hypothetical protein, conserved [Trypanosoma brucei gambiense DAL972]|eukprot:XP_011778755.1 hypothetical protein, conserved [Trypanosoma brucei gambiense DAL972]
MSPTRAQRLEGLERIACCSDVKLFFLVSGSRMFLLLLMLFLRVALPHIYGTELLWDSGTLLYDDMNSTWSLLNFPRSWDGVHFFHVAKHGYSHENVCAFFPLVPFIVRTVSWLNDVLLPEFLTAVPVTFQVALLNVAMGGAAAICLRRITILTLLSGSHGVDYTNKKGKVMSMTSGTWLDSLPLPPPYYRHEVTVKEHLNARLWKEVGATVLMWMLSPTAVFSVVLYTESVFSFATFLGVYMLIVSPQGKWRTAAAEAGAVLCFAVAGCARSNATTYIGFVLYPVFLQVFFFDTYRKRYAKRYGVTSPIRRWPSLARGVIVLIEVVIIITPYLGLNYLCYSRFVPLWDDMSRAAIGGRFWAFYGWMQKRYWNVGFLQSYRWGNAPNVLISAPIMFFTVRGFVLFIVQPALARSMETESNISKEYQGPRSDCREDRCGNKKQRLFSIYKLMENLVQSSNIICLLVILAFGATMAHVNVVNRLVMSSPALYWLWGRQFVCDPWGGNTVVMVRIFLLWNCIGALFVPNGLPWT